jgi:hypothetical protein
MKERIEMDEGELTLVVLLSKLYLKAFFTVDKTSSFFRLSTKLMFHKKPFNLLSASLG